MLQPPLRRAASDYLSTRLENRCSPHPNSNYGYPPKVVQVTESTDSSSSAVLGFANTGTPNDLDQVTICTKRIKTFIENTCLNAPVCVDSTGAAGSTLINNYILHTIAHEVGHVLGPLAPIYNASYGGNHYMSGTNVIMDQSIYYTSKLDNANAKNVNFYVTTAFTSADQSGAKLKK